MPKLRVWWIPQIPMKMFLVPVRTFREGMLLLSTLDEYDRFQVENRVKPDCANAGGLQAFDPDDTEDSPDGSWSDWYSEDGHGFDDLTDEQVDQLDAATHGTEYRLGVGDSIKVIGEPPAELTCKVFQSN